MANRDLWKKKKNNQIYEKTGRRRLSISFQKKHKISNEKGHLRAISTCNKLKENGCSMCGYCKCFAALEFHHISTNKENDVSRYTTISKIKHEASKCIVVCANCHREIHAALPKNPEEKTKKVLTEDENLPLFNQAFNH